MAFKMPTKSVSVADTGRMKRPRVKEAGHLAFLHTLPCLICGARPVHAAHIRYGSERYGKRPTGMQEKPDDAFALPVCEPHHMKQHKMVENVFWEMQKIDPFAVALALHHASGDQDICEAIILSNRTDRK